MTETIITPGDVSAQQPQSAQMQTGAQQDNGLFSPQQPELDGGGRTPETPHPAAAPMPAPALEPVQKMSQMRELVMDYGASQQAAQFFKTFADGTRLRLLQALSVRELCVSDLCALLEVSQPAVSNHLRVLSNLHIVKSRRSGKNIFYSLDDWHINAIIGMALEHLSMGAAQAW